MAAVAGRRERGGHQRSNSTPVGSTTTTTATRNNSNRNFSTSSTTATPTAASLTTLQHQRLLSKSSTASKSSANHDPAAAVPQPQSARRRLTSTKRHSSSLSQSQSVSVSPLVPNNSVSGRQDSSTTTVSAVNPPVVPNKRHSAPSADLITTRSRPTNPLHQRSASSSSSPAPTRHSRKPSDGPSVTIGRGPDSATTTATTRTSRTSTLSSSRTSRTTAAASSPARTPATTSTIRRTATSSPARTPAASRSSAAAKSQPPVSKPTHRRADSASVPSSRSSRASTSPIPPQPAPPVPSSANPPSAPPPPEASSAGIPPQIQAELDKNASIQVTQPPRRAKAPARFSSNGIATADAPPPSLAYRQIPLTAAPPPPPAIPPPPPAPQPPPPRPSVEDEVEDFQYPPPLEEDSSNSKALVTIEVDDRYLSPPTQQTQEETMTTYETEQYSRSNGGVLTNGFAGKYNATVEDDEPTITTLRDIQRIAQEERSFASSPNPLTSSRTAPSQNGDDPFLNLARSSTPRSQALLDAQARQERRRSRMMQYSVNNGRTSNLAHEYSSTTSSRPTKSTASTIVSDDSYGGVELSQEPQYQAPEQNIEADHSLSHRSSFLRRQRESQNGHVRSISEAPPRTTLTRANGTSGELPSGAPRPSQSVLRSPISTLIESDRAKNAAQARLGINDDVQSTISSGTVWDELDELKMRIKRLELTGTTAATTVSNSPRHQPQQSNSNNNNDEAAAPSPTATGPPPTIHPVLHAALAKTKIVLPEHIIKALDALANDTLNLAEAVGSTGQSTMSINPALNSPEKQLVTDRQIRRKVDNICRSLTELCVSLADGRMPFDPPPDNQVQTMPVVPQPQIQQPQIQQLPQQPPPQVQTSVFPPRVEDPIERTNTAFDYRSPSAIGHKIDREATVTPNSAARAHARFEARRASLLGAPSPQYISRQEASPSPQPGANRLSHRNSMSLRGGGDRRSMIEPEDELDMQQIPNYRSPSRASNLNTSTAHLSPLRTTFTGQNYEVSPMQRTLTLREQRAAQQAQQLGQLQQAQTNLEIASNSYLSASGLQHRRTYSTASTITPTSSTGLGLTTQRRSYLDRERGITDNVIGTALTTGSGVGSAAQPIDISRRRTEYLRAANGGEQQQQQQIQTEMGYSPPQSVSGSSMGGRSRTASVSSRVGSVRARTTNMLGSNYVASGSGRVEGLGLGRDRGVLNTTRR
ncbi:hypothetical protein TWF192_006935 [Orbilia oligospora]|uniref:Uncharacterized protein n=1 Tax=Orbilia oligospora TaxID=2813651 RepID=A0A6G1M6N9_ORBOL|nr:hypothetical protein TWF679_000080 [Orbilia oligospora]KAF3232261.1 hypothetical protein TWF191_000037 [Orbilia oligospora]KAF3246084.1 hypothetical protein TWF192_006935 [Orbilia oligospora]